MYNYIEERTLQEGIYIVENNATVRGTAKVFNVGKSTVHKDVTERLKYINRSIYYRVKRVLKKNMEERHIRGGLATKLMYQKKLKKQLTKNK